MFFNAGCLPKTVAPASRPSAFARHHLSVVAPPAIREDGGSRGFQAPECKPPNKLALATGSSSIPPPARVPGAPSLRSFCARVGDHEPQPAGCRVPHPCVFSTQGWETTNPSSVPACLSVRSQRFAEDYPHPAHNKSVGEFHDETDNCGKHHPHGSLFGRSAPPITVGHPQNCSLPHPPTRFYLLFNQQLLTNQ